FNSHHSDRRWTQINASVSNYRDADVSAQLVNDQQVSRPDDLEHALPIQRLVKNRIDSIAGITQGFLRVARDPVDHNVFVGAGTAGRLQDGFRLGIIQAQDARLKLLPAE